MKTSITQRSKGTYCIRFDLPAAADGERRQKRVTIRGTRKDAQLRAAQILTELGTTQYVDPGRQRLAEFLDEWLETKKRSLVDKTWRRYASIVRLHLKPLMGSLKLRDLQPLQIENAIAKWIEGPRLDRKKGSRCSTSVHHHFNVLNAALSCAVKWRRLHQNPCRFVDRPKRDDREISVLGVDDLRQLFHAVTVATLRIIILVAISSGLRRGELLGLQWQDIDMEAREISVRRSVERVDGSACFKIPKSKKSRRTVVIPPLAALALQQHRKGQHARFEVLGLTQSPDTVVFDDVGSIYDPERLTSRYYRAIRKAGIAVRFHDLRHSYATLLLALGANVKTVQNALGHTTAAMTNRYLHPDLSVLHEAALRMESKIEGWSANTVLDKDEMLTFEQPGVGTLPSTGGAANLIPNI